MTFLENVLKEQYSVVKVLKKTEDKSIVVWRHKELNKDVVCRKCNGDYLVYEALTEIAFENLPAVFEVVRDENKIIVLEEFISGITVADVLLDGLYDEKGVKHIVKCICDALSVVHSYGIVHRDIKPENIMITDESTIKLIDFDAARFFKNGKSNDTKIIGTAGYAAPEQLGLAQSDERTDIFALGVLMNVMLTGEHPSKKMYKGKLSKIIEKCIQLDPDKRYSSAQELKKYL